MRLVWLGVVLAGCGATEPERPDVAPEPVREALPPSVVPPPPGPTLEPQGGGSPSSSAPSPVKRVVQGNKRTLMVCHEAALKANPAVTGRVELGWTVAGGSAKDVVIRGNATGDDELAKCVASQVSGWSFAGIEDGVVQDTFYFEPMQPPGVDAQPVAGPEGVAQVVKANRGQLLWCHEEALRRNGTVAGEIQATLTLAGGQVTEAQIESNTTGDKELEACVRRKVRSWVFMGVEDGRVTLPFEFKPAP